MPAEPQLVDYIKKAKVAGQADEQTKVLLYKNGWTEREVGDAFDALDQSQPQAQTVSQPTVGPQVQARPKIQIVNQPRVEQVINRPKSHLVLKLVIVLIIIAVLAVVGYFVAGQYINLPWNPFAQSPQTVIDKMIINMKAVKSSQTIIQGEVTTKDDRDASRAKISVNITGGSDTTNVNNPKANFTFVFNMVPTGSAAPSASANVSLVSVGNASYIKLNNVVLPTLSTYQGLEVSQIVGKWYKIDQDSTVALTGIQAGQQINISQINNAGLVKQIQDSILTKDLLVVDNRLGDEVISGQNTYHYSVTVSKEKLRGLLNKIFTAQGISSTYVGSITNLIGDISIELWIGKKDFLVYKYKIDKPQVKLEITNFDFGKTMVVQAPEGSQKIEGVILPLLGTQIVNSNIAKIVPIANAIFTTNNNYTALCRNGLLNGYNTTYGTALVQVATDAMKQGAKNPSCFAGLQGYCVSTLLTDGSYVCVDERGILGSRKCVSSLTNCVQVLDEGE